MTDEQKRLIDIDSNQEELRNAGSLNPEGRRALLKKVGFTNIDDNQSIEFAKRLSEIAE